MDFITLTKKDGVATLVLCREKVNALNGTVIGELHASLRAIEDDADVKSVIITGTDKFFSFGFDIPQFLSFSKEQFTEYLVSFCGLYAYLFAYPKPVIAALNGHAIAGGCMLALACDHRVMVGGKAKISLNELTFGASVFAGATEMLRFWVGSANAAHVLYSGDMFSAAEAKALGLVHDVVADEAAVMAAARKRAAEMAEKQGSAFTSIKRLLRTPILKDFSARERQSIKEFVDIWYSPKTWAQLKKIVIR